jgi:hypothetical protein
MMKQDYSQIRKLLDEVKIPKLKPVTQIFPREKEIPIKEALLREFSSQTAKILFRPKMKIAIAVGSRGIRNIDSIVAQVVTNLKRLNVDPFIIPAMGSHGGATSEGQVEILASLGVTEKFCKAPICATMDTVEVGRTKSGVPVFINKMAVEEADGVFLINRIKPHTAFSGKFESGLVKMGSVGLGNQLGAKAFHSRGLMHMETNLIEMSEVAFSTNSIIGGLAIVENAYDETAILRLLSKQEIIEEEPALLKISRENMPRIKYDNIDVLIVEEIGKDISGDGMDPNITGRFYSPFVDVSEKIKIQRIVALDLTEESHGNSIGIGVADVISKTLFDKIHLPDMYMNALTNCVLEPAKLPLIMESEEEAIKTAIVTCIGVNKENLKIVRIKNTLSLDKIFVSEALFNK